MAVYGKDPREFASVEYGEKIIAVNIENLKETLDRKLNRVWKEESVYTKFSQEYIQRTENWMM